MRLTEREVKVMSALRRMETGKLVVVKFGGEIKAINSVVDEILADIAKEVELPTKGLVRTVEGQA